MRPKTGNDATAERPAVSGSSRPALRALQRVWEERNWTAAILFAGLLVGSWVMVIANEANPIAGNASWFRVATSAILTGLLPIIALLVLHFAWRHRIASVALTVAESRMRDMVEASSDWLWEMGPDLRFTFVSNRLPGLSDADVARFIGKAWNETVRTEFDPAGWSRHGDAMSQQRPFRDFVYLDKTPGGELRWRKVSGRPFFDQRGRFQGYRGTGTDVTEQMQAETKLRRALKEKQESEDKFRSLVADFPGAVYRCDSDPDGTVQFISDAIEDLCGRPAGHFAAPHGDGLAGMIHAADRAMVEDVIREAVAQRRPFAAEYRIVHKDGSIRWVHNKGRAMFGADGKPRHLDGAIFDVTERKQAEVALIRTKTAAENANRAKSAFLALMSHEFRTPLNAIIGFSDLIRSEAHGPIGNELYKEYLQDIMMSGNHLLALINDILDLSKAEAGKISLNEAPADIADIATESAAMVRQQAGDADVVLECSVASALPALLCDARVVKQILLNLLTNAIKFTPAGGRVMLEANLAGEGLRVVVRDTGIGIADADLPKALADFGRVDGEFGRSRPGTGLGLPLAKHLSEAHGASFVIDSQIDVGTTIAIVFPRSRLIEQGEIRSLAVA
ncbi:MAG TPA: PAS domain-containing protein [Candidatus Acidoferrum sp.]|nr:PAS domain-containing protein [Candidatus Acidoferrum sp.]